jgi:hypothetical protein
MAAFGKREIVEARRREAAERAAARAAAAPDPQAGRNNWIYWTPVIPLLALGYAALTRLEAPAWLRAAARGATASVERARLENVANEGEAQQLAGARPAWTDSCGRSGLAQMQSRGGPSIDPATRMTSFDQTLMCRLDEAAAHLCSSAVRRQLGSHVGMYFFMILGSSAQASVDQASSIRQTVAIVPAPVKAKLKELYAKGLLGPEDLPSLGVLPVQDAFRALVAGTPRVPTCR